MSLQIKACLGLLPILLWACPRARGSGNGQPWWCTWLWINSEATFWNAMTPCSLEAFDASMTRGSGSFQPPTTMQRRRRPPVTPPSPPGSSLLEMGSSATNGWSEHPRVGARSIRSRTRSPTFLGSRLWRDDLPKNLLRGGLADWIVAADSGAIVVSASRKDRAAITMAGKTRGHVYWIH